MNRHCGGVNTKAARGSSTVRYGPIRLTQLFGKPTRNGSSAIPCLDDQSSLQNQIDPTVSGSLAQQVVQQLAQVSNLAKLVPAGDTPDALNAAIAAANFDLCRVGACQRSRR